MMLLAQGGRTTVTCEMGYAENFLEHECFPQTLVMIEGSLGSIEVTEDYVVRVTTRADTQVDRFPPARYACRTPHTRSSRRASWTATATCCRPCAARSPRKRPARTTRRPSRSCTPATTPPPDAAWCAAPPAPARRGTSARRETAFPFFSLKTVLASCVMDGGVFPEQATGRDSSLKMLTAARRP